MSNISKPVDWEVYNFPPVPQPVQYYSLLKRKREFSAVIKQYDAQVFNHGYLHYCGIVPSGSLNNRYEIFIVFFNEIPNTSFIGFRVKVSKETFTCESNSLLLFLKKSQKAVFYTMNNNFIRVQCSTNAWELFYLLYDHYLRKYVITVIGTQFFYHFVYYDCILREKQLLELLYKGSKVIRVSKMSIYYKINRKRKISVTDLIHMTLNMPKSKRYITSSFSSKESAFYSEMHNGDFYTAVGNKIQISKLILRKYKNQNELCNNVKENSFVPGKNNAHNTSRFHLCETHHYQNPVSSNTSLKRKYNEIENNKRSTELRMSSKYIETSLPYSEEYKWQQYHTLKPYAFKSYLNIPFINPLVPNLRSGNSTHLNSDSHLLTFDTNKYLALEDGKIKKKDLSVSKPLESIDCVSYNSTESQNSKLDHKKAEIFDIEHVYPFESMDLDLKILSKCNIPTVSSSNLLNNLYHSNLNKKCDILASSINFQDKNKEHCNNSLVDVSLTTAAGKTINACSAAMQKACQLIKDDLGDEQILLEAATSDPVICKVSNKASLRKEANVENSPNISGNNLTHSILSRRGKISSKGFSAVSFSNTEKLGRKNLDEDEFDFSTAAGKKINISNDTMKAAQKLIQDASGEEKKFTYTENRVSITQSNKKLNIFNDVGCSSKAFDIDMDTALVEKFFEDTFFNENDLNEDNVTENISNALIHSKSCNISARKPRKSLGGRISMRHCSDKL